MTDDAFVLPPDPGQAGGLDDLVERLRRLKIWAGDPSYETIKARVDAAWTAAGRPATELAGKTTVVDCFRPGRRRLNADLVVAVVEALHPDVGYVAQWRQALRVIGGETEAAAQVRVQDRLPPDLVGFTGRGSELDRLRQLLDRGHRTGDPVVVSAIAGMAGVGKTQLAIRAGHLLVREKRVDLVLFVNLRGFHPDQSQPPADPRAVLDGFLRVLGVPGRQIPYDVSARAAAYRERVAGTRTLVVLDNAASADQVRPLLPDAPGCLTLVTSRRYLIDLPAAVHLAVDVFTPDEAVEFLVRAVPGTPAGEDARAAARIAERCGYLPLALGLVAGHISGTPGWTLTDHADRLDEHHRDRRLDTGVEMALDLSYQRLTTDQRQFLRLAALHPGQDLDAYAVAALAGTDHPAATALLRDLHQDHLLQQPAPGRYAFHDLVRAYATARATDEDRPADRRAASTRLFDYYLATAATAVKTLYPAGAHYRPEVAEPATPVPALPDPESARAWLDTERPALVAVADHTAAHGWPTYTTRLATILFRYLVGGHPADALVIFSRSRDAAQDLADQTGEARALTNIGITHNQLGRPEVAARYLERALPVFRRADDRNGEGRTLTNLAVVEIRLGRYRSAVEHLNEAIALERQRGDRTAEAATTLNLGLVEGRLGRHQTALEHFRTALTTFRDTDDRVGQAAALTLLGALEGQLGDFGRAIEHHHEALTRQRQHGHRDGEAWTLDSLGSVHTRRGRPATGAGYHQQALDIFREFGERDGQAWALNGLGNAAYADGRAADALTHHQAALAIAHDIGDRYQLARAHAGLGHAHDALGDPAAAGQAYRRALTLYTDLGTPEADEVRAHLAIVGVA